MRFTQIDRLQLELLIASPLSLNDWSRYWLAGQIN
jgi:hypothetical protein